MKTTRRFAVATLLVIAVAVVLGAPAPAFAGGWANGQGKTNVKLYPATDSPSPNASGTVTLYASSGWANYYYDAVSVSVSKLAPNASYYMPVTVEYYDDWYGWLTEVINVSIQTDARGKGEGGLWVGGSNSLHGIPSLSFQVYDSSGTLVLTYVR